MKKNILLLLLLFFISGCGNKPVTTVYDKSILNKNIECLKLTVSPEDREISSTLNRLYDFSQVCDYRVDVTFKENIVCNSHYNSQSKALGKMPNSYLKIELRRGLGLKYSYYIDLDHKPTKDDVEDGFKRFKDDLHL